MSINQILKNVSTKFEIASIHALRDIKQHCQLNDVKENNTPNGQVFPKAIHLIVAEK